MCVCKRAFLLLLLFSFYPFYNQSGIGIANWVGGWVGVGAEMEMEKGKQDRARVEKKEEKDGKIFKNFLQIAPVSHESTASVPITTPIHRK